MSGKASKLTRIALAAAIALSGAVSGVALTTVSAQAVGVSQTGGAIARSEILARAQSWVDQQVMYSQAVAHTDSNGTYRQDCSGFVSMAWHLGESATTWTLPQYSNRLGSIDDLKPGDILNNINSHVVLFVGWTDSSHSTAKIVQENRTGTPANYSTYSRAYITSNGFLPYRYKNVTDDQTPAPSVPKTLKWYLSDSATSSGATRTVFGYGDTPMVPIVGDFDGNGTDTQSTYDPTTSKFYLTNSGSAAQSTLTFGNPGNKPVLGRWDGGTDQIGVYMPETGTFYLRHEDGAVTSFAFGNGGNWAPISGDWDGNGTETVGLYNPDTSTFYLRNSLSAGAADTTITLGNANSIPIAGDWDHNGRTNIGVYIPENHTFYFRHTDGTITSVAYGDTGDTPVAGDWNGDGYATQGVIKN
ncbi:hypothetical protein [Streptomyces sp. NPDC058401]|uniref:hypothetical protein n=1 Tax=Streptomyces sp. NPDC058401 TaxID=3346480 RepID=UPI00365A81F6